MGQMVFLQLVWRPRPWSAGVGDSVGRGEEERALRKVDQSDREFHHPRELPICTYYVEPLVPPLQFLHRAAAVKRA